MSNIKEIKKKINSISSIIQITHVMKMVSYSKLRKYQKSFLHLFFSIKKMKIFFKIFSSFLEEKKFKKLITYFYIKKKILLISITSNRGLCGNFNNSVIKKIDNTIEYYKNKGKKVFLLTIGKIGKNILSKKYCIYQDYSYFLNEKKIHYFFIKKLINSLFIKKFSIIEIIYNALRTSFIQEVVIEKIFPIPFLKKKKNTFKYIFESSKKKIFYIIFFKILKTKLFKAILESSISENTARMVSMNKATENASNIKYNLTLNYNKKRQEFITKEISEIISVT